MEYIPAGWCLFSIGIFYMDIKYNNFVIMKSNGWTIAIFTPMQWRWLYMSVQRTINPSCPGGADLPPLAIFCRNSFHSQFCFIKPTLRITIFMCTKSWQNFTSVVWDSKFRSSFLEDRISFATKDSNMNWTTSDCLAIIARWNGLIHMRSGLVLYRLRLFLEDLSNRNETSILISFLDMIDVPLFSMISAMASIDPDLT